MPLEDESLISREKDGSLNEEYCQWCYKDGKFTYQNMDDLIEACIPHMAAQGFAVDQVRAYLSDMLPKLKYWQEK